MRHSVSDEHFVQVRDLTKRYDAMSGSILALDTTSFTIAKGEFLSVVGPSGCGKSTLLTAMTGLVAPTSGSITIGGEEIRGPYPECGIAFQTPALLEWRSVLDNVLLQFEMRGQDPKPHAGRASDVLASLGLEGSEALYPRELSGGMRQRVSIARAMIHDPELLLLDEPFSAVDALTRDQLVVDLQHACLQRGKDLTVLFITHHIEEAVFLGDRVLVMTPRPGRVAETISIDIDRPRAAHAMGQGRQGEYVQRVRQLFTTAGVLHDRSQVVRDAEVAG